MYLDEKNEWSHPAPRKGGRPLTQREEKVFLWLIGAFALCLLIAPVGGASIVDALISMLR